MNLFNELCEICGIIRESNGILPLIIFIRKGEFVMNLREKFDSLIDKRLNARFQKLVMQGLYARDVDTVKLENDKRERLVLLCTCKDQVYAVVCTSTSKKNGLLYFEILGHYIQAQKGVVSNDLVELHGCYEGYKAHLIVAKNVTIRN